MDVDDLRGNQDAGRPRGVRGRDFDASRLIVAVAAFEAKAAEGDVFAQNKVIVSA